MNPEANDDGHGGAGAPGPPEPTPIYDELAAAVTATGTPPAGRDSQMTPACTA
ncbi:hypothetical protein [Amycolatopsis sp. NPDC051061]|uniref:hypothetical protein n=1 Tax=Amycolatopsis sp. NPDC051061 TaxID=3155042 RepID=UPI00342249A2